MADVIKDEDVGRLVHLAKCFILEEKFSPIEIIKELTINHDCSLSEAKEAYCLAFNNETLGEYQERVVLPLLEELEKHEKS